MIDEYLLVLWPGRDAEDWYRALHLVKFYARHNSSAKKDSGFFAKGRGNQTPKQVQKFTTGLKQLRASGRSANELLSYS